MHSLSISTVMCVEYLKTVGDYTSAEDCVIECD